MKQLKVLMLNGSPRVNGNTAIALREMEQVFRENGVESETVVVGNKDIRGCIACGSCYKTGKRNSGLRRILSGKRYEYEVRLTRQALEQMKEIMHYISNDLMASDAADNLLDNMKAEIMKLSCFPKKHALIDEEPWRTEGMRKIVVKNFLHD